MSIESNLSPTVDATTPLDEAGAGESSAPPGYELLDRLGLGGMSVVYRARDTRLGREVALKFLLGGDVARLRTEAAALARLQHPHIVQVFEIGEHQGRSYLALELCPGGSLEDRLANGPLPPREAAGMLRTLAGAVQAAHDARVLHRDLKPANVLLAGAGPKVADFGLARQLDQASQSATGAIAGTPTYMAPEQARGEKDLGPAVDVYALGAILYACLTGRPPFRSATVMDTLWQVLHNEPVPVRQLNPSVPRDLETIALKCLHKDPARRYASAQSLADDLGRFLESRPIQARPVGLVERGWRWVRRNPAVASLAVLVLLVLAAGILIASAYAIQAGNEAQRANRAASDARQQATAANVARREAESQLHRSRLARYAQILEPAHRLSDSDLLATADWDLRGSEYRFLNALFHDIGQRRLPAAGGVLVHAGWSPAGQQVVVAGDDGTARVLDVASGREVRRLAIGARVVWAEFRPDGQMIATASEDKVVRLWDATGRETRSWRLNERARAAVWSPDGRRIAGVDERSLCVWDTTTGAEVYAIDGKGLAIFSAAWSLDGQSLAVGGGMGVRLYEAQTGKAIPGWDANTGDVVQVAWDGSGAYLAAALLRDGSRIYHVETGRPLSRSPRGDCLGVSWSPDGRFLALCRGPAVEVYSRDDMEPILSLPRATGHAWPATAAWSPDGRTLLTLVYATPVLWDMTAGPGPADQPRSRAGFSRLVWSPDGSRLAGPGHGDGMDFRAFDGLQTQPLPTFPDDLPAHDAAFHPRGTHLALALGGERNAVLIRDLTTGAERTLTVRDPRAVAWSPDGVWLATGGSDGVVRLFNRADGFEGQRLEGHRDVIRTVTWSPDGRYVASGGNDFIVRVWDADTGRLAAALKGHTDRVQHLAWSPHDGRLASGSFDGTARVWDVRTKREVLALRTDDPPTTSVDWSRDGRLLLTAGHLNLQVWETTTGQRLVRLECERHRHRANIWSAKFHPSGEWIVFGDGEGRLRLWPWDGPPEQVQVLEATTSTLVAVAFARGGQRLVVRDENGAIVVWDMRTGQPVPREDEPDELPKEKEARDPATGLRAVIDEWQVRVHLPVKAGGRPRDLFRRISPALWHRLQAEQMDRFGRAFHRERQLECDPFDRVARQELEDGLPKLGDDPATRALRQRWRSFQAARVAGWVGTAGTGAFLLPP